MEPTQRLPKSLWPIARRKLDQLNRVRDVAELAIPPGNRLERLRRERAGQSTVFASTTSIGCALYGRMDMQPKLRSRTITKDPLRNSNVHARRLPANRPPTHPGEMLFEEFLKPLEISRSDFAARLDISATTLNEIIREKCSITPETALRLAQVLGISADFWLGLQQDWDLWHAARSESAKRIAALEPLSRAG